MDEPNGRAAEAAFWAPADETLEDDRRDAAGSAKTRPPYKSIDQRTTTPRQPKSACIVAALYLRHVHLVSYPV